MAFLPATIVSALLEPVFDRLTTELISEYQLRRDVHKEVGKLNLTLSMIRSVLEDAEEKQTKDKAVHKWLRELKHVILDADDLLDEYATRVALKSRGDDESSGSGVSISIQRKVWKILNPCMTCSNMLRDIFTSGDIAHSITDIHERLEYINKNRSGLGLQAVSSGTHHFEITTQWRRRDTTSILADESSVLGRDEDTQKIIQLLLSLPNEAESSSTQRNVSILPIVGMGGIGKTTLVQLIFNDKTVKEYFSLRIWVCISDDFNVERVTKEIIESSSESIHDPSILTSLGTMSNLDSIQRRLMKVVEGKLFLLVLDDVWNEDNMSKWHGFLEPLKFGGRGSKIIVTTRSTKVANIIPMGMDPIYLGALSPGDLWKIFWKFAFGDTRMEHMQLEVIGKQIAERLKGLPLAAKTVGCLLNSNVSVEHWRRILQSDILALSQGEDGILPTLKLSFEHLSARLKQCFTYCSLFPKDHIFDKDQLIQLWIAQCMIQRERGLEMEDIGRDNFDDLLCRSFFQHHPNIHSWYVMHDLIHDLAEFESKDDCFRMGDVVSKDIPKTIRHISIFTDNLQLTKVINLCIYKNLRTLLFLPRDNIDFMCLDLNELITKLKRLRVLGLHGCKVTELPESIGQLQHLRYMDLSKTPIEKLPESLSRLHNLQVLRLKYCWRLYMLPKGITKLVNLRHLVAEESLISSIEGIGNLTSLQELKLFDANKHESRELKGMNQLRKLRIEHLEHVEGKEDASQVDLNNKKWLKKLKLGWRGDIKTQNDRFDEEVLEGLQPNGDLKEMIIRGYAGMSFPSWMMMMGDQSLSFLQTISLKDCREVAFLPPMGQLQSLKHLKIRGMRRIKEVGHEFYGSSRVMKKAFPSLETLDIEEMSEWEVWKGAEEGQSFFPCLGTLFVRGCPKLMEVPPLPPSIKVLKMENVRVTVLPGLQEGTSSTTTTSQQLTSLEDLYIHGIQSLTSLPGEVMSHLTSLYRLEIINCQQLTSLELQPLTSLCHLKLVGCPKLMVTTNSSPSPLEHLDLTNCSNLLTTGGLLQSFPSLKYLRIIDCQNLQSLPTELGSLSSLERLETFNCPHIQSLPDIERLPVSLVHLNIYGCPTLKERCQRERGPDWHKISHIPRIEIDRMLI